MTSPVHARITGCKTYSKIVSKEEPISKISYFEALGCLCVGRVLLYQQEGGFLLFRLLLLKSKKVKTASCNHAVYGRE